MKSRFGSHAAHRRWRWAAIAAAFLCGSMVAAFGPCERSAAAQPPAPAVGPIIQVPQTPLAAGVLSDQITVTGLTPEQLPVAQLRCYPSDGVLCRGARGWDGAIFVLFQAAKPGKYTLVLVVLSDTPKGDVFLESPVVVGGVGPSPIDPPNPPDPPVTTGRRLAVVLWETGRLTPQQAKLRLDARTDAAFKGVLEQGKHPAPQFLDKDGKDANGELSPLIARLLKEAAEASPPLKLPLLFVLDYESGAAGKTVSRGPVPANVGGLADAIKKAGG